ncbi:MAG: response regulator [Gammaproteobacteria bacterium]|nr:response regulator [Gammaproteobacteria bacterium]
MEQAPKKVLVVDDDDRLRELVVRYLNEQGFAAEGVEDGASMDARLSAGHVDLVVLDVMLPGEDGLSIARRLRGQRTLPILILSARGDEVDRIVGLEVGADDYLTKPFNPRELLARIRAILRRSEQRDGRTGGAPQPSRYAFGDFTLDLQSRRLTCNNREVELTHGELALLEAFVVKPNRVLSRDALIGELKGYERSPFDRSVDVRVTRLRRKIEPDPERPQFIRTVWGEGYMFTPQGDGSAM